jgi:hypothetical protein
MPIDNATFVLAIPADNSTLHVAAAEELAPHVQAARPPVEYYDPTGHRLLLTTVASGYSWNIDASQGTVDEQVLLDRIDTALKHLQVVADGNPPPVPIEGEVPRPTGSLPEVLDALVREFAISESPNRGNWLHLLAHAAGTAH